MFSDAPETRGSFARSEWQRTAVQDLRCEGTSDPRAREVHARLQDDLTRLEEIVSVVWGIRRETLAGHTYTRADRDYIEARKALALLARKYTTASYPALARAFRRLDHSTVVFAVKQARMLQKQSPAFAERVREAERLFEDSGRG